MTFEYLNGLHNLHNDSPLAPGKLEIGHNMLSKYCRNIADQYNLKVIKLFQIWIIKVYKFFTKETSNYTYPRR